MTVSLRGHQSYFQFTPFLERMKPAARAQDASLILTLPANAKLRVNDEDTPVASTTPRFTAPDLRPGQTYTYHFQCTFARDGKLQTVARRVDVRAGEQVRVDLRTNSPAVPANGTFVVSMPPNARLKVNGVATAYSSKTPRFTAPGLEPGRGYEYQFQCSFTRDGKEQTVTRQLTIRAGEEVRVDLTDLPAVVATRR